MMKIFLVTFVCALCFCITSCDQNSSTVEPQKPQEYECTWDSDNRSAYLYSIDCPLEFDSLSGPPLLQIHSNVKAIKIVYEIATSQLYFVASSAYQYHYFFCKNELNYPKALENFNDEQYRDGPERLYYLASINYYNNSDIYALEFFADDRVDAQGVQILYNSVVNSCYFSNKVRFLPKSTRQEMLCSQLSGVLTTNESEIFGSQNYQALNPQQCYGWLRKIDISDIAATNLDRHDVVLVNGLPLEIPVIAGIITTVFQTPLSHVNVLSHNRATPNMSLKTAWNDPQIEKYIDKLIYLQVAPDTFIIREATFEEAELFWKTREPVEPKVLECHDDTSGLFDMVDLSHESLNLVGAKAANFAELCKIRIDSRNLPVPEAAFAIPFYYYRKHLSTYGIDIFIDSILSDSTFKTDYHKRSLLLEKIRDTITDVPLETQFVKNVEEKILSLGSFESIRFRSSTNVEDIEGFNGAGLYESHTAIIGDSKKSVEKAIKKVFASLWTHRGFEEREYFKIDHQSAAMGILVHRSYPDEEANGVAITGNIYKSELPAFTINVQIKGISVVSPPQGFVADQLLIYTIFDDWVTNPAVEYISKSNVNNGQPVMSNDEIVELARWLDAIKKHFYFVYRNPVPEYLFTMDVEFKLDRNRKLYIKQARPY